MRTEQILGLNIHNINVDQLLQKISDGISQDRKLKIFYLNVHAFQVAAGDAEFASIINEGDFVFCDGFGVKIGARMLGLTIGQRMTPPDWIDDLCNRLANEGRSIFLLGDEPGVAEACALQLKKKHPGLEIKGTHHGYFDKKGEENAALLRDINEKKPAVLLVGFGMPLQEKWISENAQALEVPVCIAVGAMFRWISGVETRAPKILSSNGFEGVWRLFTQPGKVWKRYIIEVPMFFFRIISTAMLRRNNKTYESRIK